MSAPELFAFDNTYARELDGHYARMEPEGFAQPSLLELNRSLAVELGIDPDRLASVAAEELSGNVVPAGASPLAQAYAGHQFGGFSPVLGDGRAMLLGELIDVHGRRRDLQLKGSGRTPFSRGGDGKAALGPVLREYLMGEAMHHLGIPTTRALAVVATGESIVRDGALPGAVLTRVAASHIRVGTFEFFSARGEHDKLRQLADYSIQRHYPDAAEASSPYVALLERVAVAQAQLIAQWMHVGFIHGVMNTDNATISGETIDYGPCAFMDTYSPTTVFSSIDHNGRYAYGNQPAIGQWNIMRLAVALAPLFASSEEEATEIVKPGIALYADTYGKTWLTGMGTKLGLTEVTPDDLELVQAFLGLLESQQVDYTNGVRGLSDVLRGSDQKMAGLFSDVEAFGQWAEDWRRRLTEVDHKATADAMDRVNPIYIPRNHKVEEALTAAIADDLAPFRKMLDVGTHPFDAKEGLDAHAEPAPTDFGPYQTFCGT